MNTCDDQHQPQKSIYQAQCPCCDYISLPKQKYDVICRICFWHYDGSEVDQLDKPSWANHMNLREARANFKKFGASQMRVRDYVLSEQEKLKYEYQPRHIT